MIDRYKQIELGLQMEGRKLPGFVNELKGKACIIGRGNRRRIRRRGGA